MVTEESARGFPLQDAASALATSKRSLQRRCQGVLWQSSLAFSQDWRVKHAQSLIRSGYLDLKSIAAEVGYETGATLRSLLRERLGCGVRELRSDLL
ncbi:helix-turn-helix domain-containing protein [Caballeronia sp. LjRoot29]|uniref:helix-turn-helix domain-containing protein n=1 Tax=Caballeronia sp. LjRoot29 TaxID=3342315 RepID=UPI003ECE1959